MKATTTLANCWVQIARAYPGWDNAWDWLDEVLENGKQPKKASRSPFDTALALGDELLAQFTVLPQNFKTLAEVERVAKVSLSGQKCGREEGDSPEWSLAHLVQQCLRELKGASYLVRGKVDVRVLAKDAIGGESLAEVDGVFGALHAPLIGSLIRKAHDL
ncbi:hypothetical protein DAEQUDRAFT_767967 [Daedalea quercina L-15889]|uniref:Uncharacterized protein n=1 Tax=Daedalea quercina L-15889 TaxID=1314783 RepID=A0A165N4J7_9APHY|nr:hypothetical protein DAEQUDRAFT_767967 [Daedalea quercina L-15889]